MENQKGPLGWSVIAGNPVDGFHLWGVFDTPEQASEAAESDKTMPPDWWVIAINRF